MRASPERFARCRSAWRWPPDFRRLRRPEPLPELRMDHGAPWARTSAPAPRAPAGRAAAGPPPPPAAAAPEGAAAEAEGPTPGKPRPDPPAPPLSPTAPLPAAPHP